MLGLLGGRAGHLKSLGNPKFMVYKILTIHLSLENSKRTG